MGNVQYLVLGDLQVLHDGHPVDLGFVKQRTVLGLLLAAAPEEISIEVLTDELWGSSPPSDPRRNLQVYVSALRKSLGAGEAAIRRGRVGYQLVVDPEQVDAAQFEAEARAATTALQQADPETAIGLAERALGRWRGRAWHGLDGARALAFDAARLDERRRQTRTVLARARLAAGRHGEALADLRRLVEEQPLDEELRHDLMLALHRAGRRDEALACYRAGRRLHVESTGLEPGARLQKLHDRVLGDDPRLLVEEAEIRARRHLPSPATRLIGRCDEVEELRRLLTTYGARLVTLTGPGGIGKTRVALAAAHSLAVEFPDGVWFVGLSDLADHRLVPEAVAAALSLDLGPDGAEAAVLTQLADARALLVLDNFEQVDDAAPAVARLVSQAPGVSVLVTSRAGLRLYGEHVVALDPLPGDDAVRLFSERARAVSRRFDVTRRDQVAAICAALDHLPLALELVAARADEMTPAEILATLSRAESGRLDLATRGPRDHEQRQRTMRDAIAWSVNLLAADVAAAFRRLGVFLGGFDADAAAKVADVDSGVLDVLVGASLLDHDPVSGRYSMFQTVREYAEESEDGERRRLARSRHAAWYHELAQSSTGGMRGPALRSWLDRLGRERANMRLAMAWFADAAQERPLAAGQEAATRLLEMTAALGLFWYRDSPGSGDVEWLLTALRLGAECEPALRGRAWYALAICRAEQGRSAEALEHSRECRALLSAVDDTWRARVLNTLGGIARDMGRPDEAAPMMDESIALRRVLGDPSLSLPMALANRAMVARDLEDLEVARACLAESLKLAEDAGDQLDCAVAQAGLAEVAVAEGRPTVARQLLGQCVPAFSELGQKYRLMECLETLAAIAVLEGDLGLAETMVTAADRALAEDHSAQVPADTALRERRVGRHLEAMDPEARAAAEARGREMDLAGALEIGLADRPQLT